MKAKVRLWLGRVLIGVVLLINAQVGLVFFLSPQAYAPSFEFSGAVGQATIQGLGVLFLMWNVPYVVALINPSKYRISLYEAIVMQAIGLIGESLIYWQLPAVHSLLGRSILRFIVFDGGGLIALVLAAWITHQTKLR
jgi:hypothetical protein